jgi:hypothetical protein
VYNTFAVQAGVMELVDVTDSKSVGGNIVWVRVPPPAPTMSQRIDTMFVFVLCGIFMPENADFTGFSGCFIVCCECRKFRRALISFFETPILLSIAAVPPTNR